MSVALATLVWPLVRLPFSNPLGIMGFNVRAGFNPVNNVLRYLLFISLPSLAFQLGGGARLRWEHQPTTTVPEMPTPLRRVGSAVVFGWAIATALVVVETTWIATPLDFLHDGEKLSAAYNYVRTGRLWTGSFFVHGVVYDQLHTAWSWRFFGVESIGAMRIAEAAWSALLPIVLAVFLLTIAMTLRPHVGPWRSFAIVPSGILVYVASERRLQYLDVRDVYALLAATVLLLSVGRQRVSAPLSSLAGFAGALGMFNTIERGAYVLIAGAASIAFLTIGGDRRGARTHAFGWSVGVLTGVLGARLAFGHDEIVAFAANLRFWITSKELMDGLAYPTPFSRAGLVFTTPLVLNAVNLLVFSARLPRYRREGAARLAAVHGLLVVLAIVYLRSALGRADAPHVMYAAAPAYLVFVVTLMLCAPNRAVRPLALMLTLALAGVGLREMIQRAIDLPRFSTFVARTQAFAGLGDEHFLGRADQQALTRLRTQFAEEPCSFVYPMSPAWHYLLRKPSCSRFYFTWFATARPHQAEVIATLERVTPGVILWDGPPGQPEAEAFSRAELYPLLDAYLRAHYAPAERTAGITVARALGSGGRE
ncbi:MAG: hypothetical protein K2X99_13135 [Gemmatimonadaceae bacterium]|nr:hypothetical protein [Gemmatimonadaceae bacterium]